jgi:hypothetical protein
MPAIERANVGEGSKMKSVGVALALLASLVGLLWLGSRRIAELSVASADDGLGPYRAAPSQLPALLRTMADIEPVRPPDEAVQSVGVPDQEPAEDDEVGTTIRIEEHQRGGPPQRGVVMAVIPAINGVLEAVTRETQGTVDSIDCRDDGCIVDLTWNDRENALAQKAALLAAGEQLNCQPSFALRGKEQTDGRAVLFLEGCRAADPSPP